MLLRQAIALARLPLSTTSPRMICVPVLATSPPPVAPNSYAELPSAFCVAAAFGAAVMVAVAKPLSSSHVAMAETSALTPAQVMDVTSMVAERIKLPLVPSQLQELVISECVQIVANEMAKQLTKEQLKSLSTSLGDAADGLTHKERSKIIKNIAKHLDAVPLVPLSIREQVVSIAVDVILGDSSVGSLGCSAFGSAIVSAGGAVDALLDDDCRKRLATRINKNVDIPVLNDKQEQVLFEKSLDTLAAALDVLIPKAWWSALQGASASEVEDFKQNLVLVLHKRLNIPFLDDELEKRWARTAIDAIFEIFLDSTGLHAVALTPEAQLARLDQVANEAKLELDCARKQAQRREAVLQRRLARILEQKKELQKDLGTGAFHTIVLVAISSATLAVAAALFRIGTRR